MNQFERDRLWSNRFLISRSTIACFVVCSALHSRLSGRGGALRRQVGTSLSSQSLFLLPFRICSRWGRSCSGHTRDNARNVYALDWSSIKACRWKHCKAPRNCPDAPFEPLGVPVDHCKGLHIAMPSAPPPFQTRPHQTCSKLHSQRLSNRA